MMELFADTSSWDTVATKNWAVAGGESLGLGAVFGAEFKILQFTHQDLGKTKGLLMVSASVGAKLEASVDAGWLKTLLEWGGHAKKVSDGSNANPFNYSPPAKVRVDRAFCLKDLEFANAVSGSVGATGGVVDAGVAMFAFFARNGQKLFSMDDVTVQGCLGAGINMGSLQGSRLINLRPTALSPAQQAANRQFQKNIPYKYSPSRRPAGGW